jgi:predicted nucleic acid-binding Zn ribbon protein
MSEPDEPEPEGLAPSDPPEEPVERSPEAAEPHDPTGLGLARSVARSLSATARTGRSRRTPRSHRGGPPGVGPGPQVSGAHPDDRDPQPLAAAVERLVDSKGWTTEVNVRSLLARWAALVGPVNAAHSHPESYTDTVLTVRTDSTAWATQLRLMAPQLVAMLNAALGDGTVTRVTVKGPDGPSWKKGRLSVRDGRGPRDTYG